jgi:hypothetical protein
MLMGAAVLLDAAGSLLDEAGAALLLDGVDALLDEAGAALLLDGVGALLDEAGAALLLDGVGALLDEAGAALLLDAVGAVLLVLGPPPPLYITLLPTLDISSPVYSAAFCFNSTVPSFRLPIETFCGPLPFSTVLWLGLVAAIVPKYLVPGFFVPATETVRSPPTESVPLVSISCLP